MENLSQSKADSGADAKKNVICVLLQEQVDDYEKELGQLKSEGASLLFVDDPDEAFATISKVKPDMIIVGMDLGEMEGFEFLAMLTSRIPEYENPAVVLPDKADGLPPVVHSRKQDTGHSAVDGVDFNYITSLLYPPGADDSGDDQTGTVQSKKEQSSQPTDKPKAAASVDAKSPLVDKPKAAASVDAKSPLADKPKARSAEVDKTPLDDQPEAKPVVDQRSSLKEEPKAKPVSKLEIPKPKDASGQSFSIDFPTDPDALRPRRPSPPPLEEPPTALFEEQAPILASRSRSKIDKKYLFLGGGVSLVLVLVGGYLGLSGTSESDSLEPASQSTKVASNNLVDEDKQGIEDEADDRNQEAINTAPKPASDEAEPVVDTEEQTEVEQADSVDKSLGETDNDVGLVLPKELILPLSFEIGSSEAEINDEQRLDAIVQALASKENTQIVLTGHASVQGSSEINHKLGLQRAEAAKKILLKHQIPSHRIRTASLGSDVPISDKDGEEEQQHNRRVTVTLQQIL